VKLVFALLVTFSFLISPASAQNTIRVPADASTVQAAIDRAVDGDTVLVSPGIYNENITFSGKAITVTSGAQIFTDTSAVSTVLNGTADGPVVTFAANEPAGAVLNGFTVRNGHANTAQMNGGGIFVNHASPQVTNNDVTNNLGCGVYVVNSASPLIQGNDIRQTMDSGKSLESQCNSTYGFAWPGTGLALAKAGNVRIIGNTIEENTVVGSHGECEAGVFVTSGAQILLQNNIIRNNRAPCGQGLVVLEDAAPEKLILIQNLFYGNTDPDGNSELQVFVSGTFSPPYPSLIEINNTIYGGGQETLLNFSESTIANNIFVNTTLQPTPNETLYAGISCQYPQIYSYPELSHNTVFNFGTLIAGGCALGAGNLAVNPQFVNPSGNDFHAKPSSPSIATADLKATMLPAADLDEKARIVCDTVDMGSYELHPHPLATLTASPNPTPGRSTVTLTAMLTGNCNNASGLVTFTDGKRY
jgi:parallel beta-helix repeat protein